MNGSRGASRADWVFETLEGDILSGSLAAGELLTELKLCERMGLSRTPVREALHRLMQEGLLEETTHGMVVRGISESDLADIYEIRRRIEGYATRLCAERITEEQLAEMREVVDLQDFYTARGGAANIRDADTRFHEMVYRYCGSDVLHSMLTDLHRKIKRFRKASVENPERARIAVREHADILRALEARDGDKAEQLAVLHIENARGSIVLTTSADPKN
ncbi:MAG: GntR family transcriptional regulator [Clostridia bacterium]|nr:GntR family transcriptional regulator [Clostridia bacterium]